MLALALLALGCRPVEDAPRRGLPPMQRITPRKPKPSTEPTEDAQGSTTVVIPNFAKITERLSPSIVTVVSTVEKGKDAATASPVRGLGSGMVVSAGGQILTNQHVVAEASSVEVELSTHDRMSAQVLVADPMLDLALLEITDPGRQLEPVEFSDRDPVPGEWVMALGQPLGLGHTVTVGVISGLHRDFSDLGRPSGLRADGIWSFIQTDASINIGNSGGPLVDADGKVVGITTAVRNDAQGLAFAIPSAMARRFLEEVWTYGRVRHARLGIRGENVGPRVFPGRGSSVRITHVEGGGPGAKAGLKKGDFILAINDIPVARVSDVAYLSQLLGVGARIPMTIKRVDRPVSQVLIIPSETK
jgi:S1-C subfamily serine protease